MSSNQAMLSSVVPENLFPVEPSVADRSLATMTTHSSALSLPLDKREAESAYEAEEVEDKNKEESILGGGAGSDEFDNSITYLQKSPFSADADDADDNDAMNGDDSDSDIQGSDVSAEGLESECDSNRQGEEEEEDGHGLVRCSSSASLTSNCVPGNGESSGLLLNKNKMKDLGTKTSSISQMVWTDDKHSSYLDLMEANFVKSMYDREYCSADLCGQQPRPPRDTESMEMDCVESQPSVFYTGVSNINDFTYWQSKAWKPVYFSRSVQSNIFPHNAISLLENPWIRHFRPCASSQHCSTQQPIVNCVPIASDSDSATEDAAIIAKEDGNSQNSASPHSPSASHLFPNASDVLEGNLNQRERLHSHETSSTSFASTRNHDLPESLRKLHDFSGTSNWMNIKQCLPNMTVERVHGEAVLPNHLYPIQDSSLLMEEFSLDVKKRTHQIDCEDRSLKKTLKMTRKNPFVVSSYSDQLVPNPSVDEVPKTESHEDSQGIGDPSDGGEARLEHELKCNK